MGFSSISRYRNGGQSGFNFGEITVDNFAGGGGASTGIEAALGHPVDIAINHDPAAVAIHEINHPHTLHLCESVWDVNPVDVCAGRPVGLAWFSPDCKHFSKAKGGKPVEKKIRGLAWVVMRWAATVRPRVIMLENVEEFVTWGPLVRNDDGTCYPCPKNKGRTFNSFKNALRRHGYEVEHRELRACDYGAPTIRKRLFLIARCDGQPITWPEPTHGDPKSEAVKAKRIKPWRTAAECIDWSIPCPSIFERKRPLADATLRRIAKGVMRYVVEAADPFIVTYYGSNGLDFRGQPISEPMRTQTTENRHALVMPILTEHANASSPRCMPADEPLRTICATTKGGHHALVTAGGTHIGEVRAFLMKYYGTDQDPDLREPLHTITTKDRFGLVTVRGEQYQLADIGMRMLSPRELFRAQGFPDNYIIERTSDGRPITKTEQVAKCGNSVCPPIAEALVRANLSEQRRAVA